MQLMQASTPSREGQPVEKRDERAIMLSPRHPLPILRRYREQLLYLVVGAWNTVFGYAEWAVLQFLLGDRLHYLVIVVISWPIAVLNAYLGYRYIVFRSRGSILRELPRFSTVYVATLLATLVALPIALAVLPFSIYVINGGFTCVVVVASYLAHKHFSFGGRRGHAEAAR